MNERKDNKFKNPVVMLLNGRGDYLLNLPALRAISQIFSGEFTLITKKGAHGIFFPELPAARILEPDYTMSPAGPEFDALGLATAIGATDLFLSLNPWHTASSDGLLRHLAAAQTVGFFSEFDVHLPLDFSKHSSELAFDIVSYLSSSLTLEEFYEMPVLAPRYCGLAQRIRNELPEGASLAVVHGDTKAEKRWGSSQFAEVMRWMLARDPNLFIFDLGLNSIDGNAFANESRVIACRELVLPAAIALTGLADIFIGVDSCFLHAADLYRVPGVGLFGPTSCHEFGFKFARHRHVAAKAMEEIMPTDVIHAIEDLLVETNLLHGSSR